MKSALIFLIPLSSLLIALTAHADVYKCENAKGMTEFSDVPCQDGVKTNIQSSPAPQASGVSGNANERALGIYVREAIAQGDFQRASKLAVTKEQFDWIREAQSGDSGHRIAQGSPVSAPTECKFSSFKYGDPKGEILAKNAKAECLQNNELKAAGRGNEISLEHYNYWKSHSQTTKDSRNAAAMRDAISAPINCTPTGAGSYQCQ